MLLSDYLQIGEALENVGVFDPVLDKDNAFFINIQRLKETTTPEFEGSYERINDFFRKIIKLLDRAEQKNVNCPDGDKRRKRSQVPLPSLCMVIGKMPN